MILLTGEHDIVAAYVGSHTGDQYSDISHSLGVLTNEGRIIGGFVFSQYTGFGVEMSLAGSGCISRSAWQKVGEIVFSELKCARLSVTTRRRNKKVCKLAPRLHFKFEAVLRKYYGDEDGIHFSLLREEAIKHGLWKDVSVK